jgi:hypothetical protein
MAPILLVVFYKSREIVEESLSWKCQGFYWRNPNIGIEAELQNHLPSSLDCPGALC